MNLNVQTTKMLNCNQSLKKWKKKNCPWTLRYGLLSMRLEISFVICHILVLYFKNFKNFKHASPKMLIT